MIPAVPILPSGVENGHSPVPSPLACSLPNVLIECLLVLLYLDRIGCFTMSAVANERHSDKSTTVKRDDLDIITPDETNKETS